MGYLCPVVGWVVDLSVRACVRARVCVYCIGLLRTASSICEPLTFFGAKGPLMALARSTTFFCVFLLLLSGVSSQQFARPRLHLFACAYTIRGPGALLCVWRERPGSREEQHGGYTVNG